MDFSGPRTFEFYEMACSTITSVSEELIWGELSARITLVPIYQENYGPTFD